jgi:hypothetical protein
MRRLWKRRALICWLVLFSSAQGAIAGSWSFYSETALEYAQATFQHDASMFNPILGSPTSSLIYPGQLHSSAKLGFRQKSGEGSEIEVSIKAAFRAHSEFIDNDYLADQVLFSQTTSRTQVPANVEIAAKFRSAPIARIGNATTLSLAIETKVGHDIRENRGLICGGVCQSLPFVTDTQPVITHRTTRTSIRLGPSLSTRLGERTTFDMSALVGPSLAIIDDTHHLRTNQGSPLQIQYTLFGLEMGTVFAFEHEFSEFLSVQVGITANAAHLFGQAQFSPNNERSPLLAGSAIFEEASLFARFGGEF